jgi:hypothetical protein
MEVSLEVKNYFFTNIDKNSKLEILNDSGFHTKPFNDIACYDILRGTLKTK